MKKNHTPLIILALVLALASLALSAFTVSTIPEDQTHLIDDLYRENQALRSQIDELNARLDQMLTVVSLQDWSLEVAPWADSTGADITFSAVPTEYQPGVSATLLIQLDGREVVSVPCQWDGSTFGAATRLDAADGYSYYCLLSAPGGTQQLPLTSPMDPVLDIPVYLASSLSAYCNLSVSDWTEAPDSLTLTDAYAQVQLPRISAGGDVQISTAKLVLRRNDSVIVEVPLNLNPSEVSGSFELAISDVVLPLSGMENGDTLELSLEVTLTDGRNLKAFGISWFLENGTFSSAVG